MSLLERLGERTGQLGRPGSDLDGNGELAGRNNSHQTFILHIQMLSVQTRPTSTVRVSSSQT